jgi:hypothetical protein
VTSADTARRVLPSKPSSAGRTGSPLAGTLPPVLTLSLRARAVLGRNLLRRDRDRAPPASP